MQNTRFAVGLKMTLTVFTVTLMANTVALGQTAATLFDFTPATATQPELGTIPYGGLVGDASGNLYGTTSYGGRYGLGTVFELSVNPAGGYTKRVLHEFAGTNGPPTRDGASPYATLTYYNGNLYGTTVYGGINNANCEINGQLGCGTVFELSPGPGRRPVGTTRCYSGSLV